LKENFDRFNFGIHKEKEMADFRRWVTALAVVLLFAGLASAQVGGGGGTQLTCSVNTSNTPTLRSEGIAEQVGDIVITCTGGQIVPNLGSTPPGPSNPLAQAVNITVSLTSSVTSRLLTASAVSEALLLIDEPNSGLAAPLPGYGPQQPFTPCPYPGPTQNGCAGPTSPAPAYVLTQTAGAPPVAYQTAVTSATAAPGAASPAPNTYQGVVSGNQVTFYGVPVVPPGTTGARVFRITNVRVNASGIGGGSASGSLPVQASILTSNPSALPISNPTPIVGFVQQSLSAGVATAASFGQCNSQTQAQATVLSFKELFASAFKTRVDPTVSGQINGQGSALVQNRPGVIYNSESGFTLSVNGTTAGLADFGTRFTAVFNNVPAGLRLFVSQYNVNTDPVTGIVTGQATSTSLSYAQAITSDTVPDGNGTIPAATAASGPGTGGTPGGVSVVEITPSAGTTTATASWEVINTQTTAIDTYKFGVFVTYVASPGTNTPAAGVGTVNARYGPVSTFTSASSSAPVPRFLDTSSAKNAIQIGLCRTILLFPYVTNQAGFDTGLAVANSSTDPFGTTPQNGTCAMNWYGTAAPAVMTSPTIPTATVWATLTSTVAPGFGGYVIAVCNFQYAHGFAFVSDVGARNLAMGYLALVVPDPNLNGGRLANDLSKSGTSSGEQLGE
jgi:hypothetical protein